MVAPGEVEDATEALQLADRRMYAQKGGRRMSAGRQSRDVLLSTLTEREPELGEHLHDVAKLAMAVGRELDMSPEELDEVARAAELHDVGKVAIPDAILNKPGPLDEAEWSFMRRHTIIGERILLSAPALRPVARLVRSSHERWDGGGYPDGLAGEEIPLGRADRRGLRRLRRDDHRPPLPAAALGAGGPGGAGGVRRERSSTRAWSTPSFARCGLAPSESDDDGRRATGSERPPPRSGLEPPRGHPQHPLTGDGQLRVAQPVLLERAPGVVGRAAVQLHHQPRVAPEEVDLVAVEERVHLGPGQAVRGTELEEALLQLGPGPRAAGVVVGEDGQQPAVAGPARDRPEARAVEAEVLGLVEGALERPSGQDVGEVHERAGGRGDGDAVDGWSRRSGARRARWSRMPVR